MPEDEQKAAEWLRSEDVRRASKAYDALVMLLDAWSPPEAATLLTAWREDPPAAVQILMSDLPLCKAIEYVAVNKALQEEQGSPLDQFTMSHLFASMSGLFLIGFDKARVADSLRFAFESFHRIALEKFLTLSAIQADDLCRYLNGIASFLGGLALGNVRLFLIDLPVGNSLPVALLRITLERDRPVTVLRGALSRNDSKRVGLTRKELLAELISDANLRPNDVVIFFDEWNTGANFYTLARLLRKIIPAHSFFLPAAVLSQNAAHQPHYAKYCTAHDKMLAAWGQNGSSFRRVLLPLETFFPLQGYFFWAENDRLAGYRKMQVHGSLFSSFDAIIEHLRTNDDDLVATMSIHLAETPDHGLPASLPRTIETFREMFSISYEDYLRCRDELYACSEDLVSGHEFPNLSSCFDALFKKYFALIDHRSAKAVIMLAVVYWKRLGGSDPVDRYYFRHHAPGVEKLEGQMNRTHEVALAFLNARMNALGRS